MIIKNKMVKRLISTFLMSLLLTSMMLVIGAGKVYAQGSVSSTSLQVSADCSDYYIIGSDFYNHFVRPTTIDLAKNKVVYNKQILTVYNGRIDKWKMSFLNQDSSGKSWFKFLSYPEATKGALQTVTYVYSKNPVVAADVTVRYVDIENNPISEDIILQGNIGENYYTDKKILKIIL